MATKGIPSQLHFVTNGLKWIFMVTFFCKVFQNPQQNTWTEFQLLWHHLKKHCPEVVHTHYKINCTNGGNKRGKTSSSTGKRYRKKLRYIDDFQSLKTLKESITLVISYGTFICVSFALIISIFCPRNTTVFLQSAVQRSMTMKSFTLEAVELSMFLFLFLSRVMFLFVVGTRCCMMCQNIPLLLLWWPRLRRIRRLMIILLVLDIVDPEQWRKHFHKPLLLRLTIC